MEYIMTVASKLGRGIGTAAAYTVHGAIRAAVGAGSFTAEVAHSAELGYTEQSAMLKARREAQAKAAVAHRAALDAANAITVAVVAG
jgi:hypothetical protein